VTKHLTLVITLILAAPLGAGQEVIDRVLSRVNGQIVTLSDLRQCRSLKLLAVDGDSDEAYQRALENRLLILREISRGAAGEADQQAIASRRREWEGLLGSGPPVQDRLAQAGMSADALDAWLANDVRIKVYLDQRFSSTPAADRPQVVNHWIDMLRQRAGLR
jgi:hypothetical protein